MLAWEIYDWSYIAYCQIGHALLSSMAVSLVLLVWTGIIYLFPTLGNFIIPKWSVLGLQLSFLGFVASLTHLLVDITGVGY